MAERKPFLLRIDPTLWSELEAWAQDELRSVNGQIEYLLRQAVQKRKGVEATGSLTATKPAAPMQAESASSAPQQNQPAG
jgi:hypothetical protein